MERQNFDPIETGIHGTVDFMEGIEASEPPPEQSKPKAKTPAKKKKADNEKKPPYYCEQHGENYTHDTKDCRFLNNNKNSSSGSKNKSWNCKAAEASKKSKKDLAALISKTVNRAVKKQLASADKKRKLDEDGERYLVNVLTKDLDGSNYKDMANLKIDDDESVHSEASC